ncbi:MAG: radical SAM protein [Flavobacteriaceae bacterium]
MNRHLSGATGSPVALSPEKFRDPDVTARGEARARVALTALDTLWFNTGTLCNITCASCYIESSPTNDRLVYLAAAEVEAFLDEIAALDLGTREIGFTGGEPFMNPDFPAMLALALERGHEALVLTNAMQPMQRPRVKQALLDIGARFGDRLTLRVSLDHHSRELHEKERGERTWARALAGMDWLAANGFRIAIAGRTCWGESEEDARAGYARLIAAHGWAIDAGKPGELVLFPEMDATADVPEITTACWGILGKSPGDVMCATSRMVVKRKGEDRPVVLPCTLLPYDADFEMGETLAASLKASGRMFEDGAVKLCHPHCARFCVLGGASCSG